MWRLPPSCAQLSLSALARCSSTLWFRSAFREQKGTRLKMHPKTRTEKQRTALFPSQNCWRLLKKINTSAHSQEAIWWTFCMATKSEAHWPVFRRLLCFSPFMYFCSLFCNGEERQAICFWNQTWSLPFKLLPIPRWKGALSNANKFTHIPKAEKQVLWRFFPPLINEEMEHILTKSSEQGWQSRCDHANRSGSYSDGK